MQFKKVDNDGNVEKWCSMHQYVDSVSQLQAVINFVFQIMFSPPDQNFFTNKRIYLHPEKLISTFNLYFLCFVVGVGSVLQVSAVFCSFFNKRYLVWSVCRAGWFWLCCWASGSYALKRRMVSVIKFLARLIMLENSV